MYVLVFFIDGVLSESSSRQFNNTLAPYDTCANANAHNKGDRSLPYVKEWAGIYLAEAQKRLQADLQPSEGGQGFNLEIEDAYRMQQMCAYEVAYSRFLPGCCVR